MTPSPHASERSMLGVAGSLSCTSGDRHVELIGRESIIEARFNFMPWSLRGWKLSQLPKPLDRTLITWWLYSGIAVHVFVHDQHVATATPGSDSHYNIRYHWGGVIKAGLRSLWR